MIGSHTPTGRGTVALGGLLAFVLLAPLVSLVLSTSLGDLRLALERQSVWSALQTSLVTSAASLVLTVVLGTPLAWALATRDTRMSRALELGMRLPIVLPPSVAGVALLLAFGQRGLLSGWLYPRGTSLAFTPLAVVLAQLLVSAPLYVQAATSAFRRLEPSVLLVARSLGAGPARLLTRVAVPIAAPALLAGAALTWARALGEFGATLLFAGNMEGSTQTLPLAIYTSFEGDLGVARALSSVLLALALVVLVWVRWLERRSEVRP